MRKGTNPFSNAKIKRDAYHRIIVPVFIPNLKEEYFFHGLEVTKLCLESLIRTRHPKTFLSVVNNGSCREVTNYLQQLYDTKKVDQLVHYKENIGKIDAVISIAKVAEEPLITITDGDVLFKQDWMQGVEEVFEHFPEAGMVSPVPHGTVYNTYTINTLFDAFFKGILTFQSICNPEDMLRFAESIGKKDTMYKNKAKLKYQLTVKRSEYSAVVGCGHFVATLRKEVFLSSPKKWSHLAYASVADRDYIDIPNEKAKLWRLATVENYAYHIGNNPTDWMISICNELKANSQKTIAVPKSKKCNTPLWFKKGIVRILMSSYVRPYFFKKLGLTTHRDNF